MPPWIDGQTKNVWPILTGDACQTVNKVKTSKWTGKVDLKIITGTLNFAAQALRTNQVEFNIDNSVESNLCRQKGKTINHIISECKYLAQE